MNSSGKNLLNLIYEKCEYLLHGPGKIFGVYVNCHALPVQGRPSANTD